MDCFKLETLFVIKDYIDEPAESMKVVCWETIRQITVLKCNLQIRDCWLSRAVNDFIKFFLNMNQIFFSLVVKYAF
jgi:hypothetical protein